MRQFERDDVLLAAAGDANALIRVERREDVLKWNAEQRKMALQCATPSWADLDAIKALYAESRRLTAETGVKHEVDHIIPIQNRRVCGLHVHWNLRVITKSANARKHARFGDDDVVGFLSERGYEIVYGINRLKRAIKIGRREWVQLIGPGLQESLSIGYVHGEFVIEPGTQLVEGKPMPPVAIAWAKESTSNSNS